MNANPRTLLSAIPGTAALADLRSGRQFDAEEIENLAARQAADLAKQGIGHGDRVVVACDDPVDFVLSIFACWVVGATAVAVSPGLAPSEQANVIETTGARFWNGPLKAELPISARAASSTARPLGHDEPALILMTSGTTGKPKGIVHSLRGLMARVALNIAEIGRDDLRETLCVLPVFFGHGLIGNVLTPIFAGGRVHLWPTPQLGEMRDFAAEFSSRKITFMSSVPSFWRIALRVAGRPAAPPRRLQVGSAPLSLDLWREIAAWSGTDNVFNLFGMTETANWIAGGSLRDEKAGDGYVGRAWGGHLGILDETGAINPSGRGEVVVLTPSIMLGYWQREDLEREAFAGSWFRTGDIGEIDGDGDLFLLGRMKSEINRGGIKIQAEEVDMMLERHEDIIEACAFGIPDPVAGEAVAVAIVLREGARFDADALKAWCRKHARADAVPVRIDRLDAIPRNDRGKVVRDDVRRAVESRSR